MQPHANLGINFRKHFSLHWSKKKEIKKLLGEEREINAAYKKHNLTLEGARALLDNLAARFFKVKGASGR